ncbi:Fur family transcriptional regulator [Parvimonas sp. G1604]|uniref:Fur family transcriptional regulator n=1 Tax=Parvimonas sp. G1604 TaxID=3388845 RepID=UPI00397F946E
MKKVFLKILKDNDLKITKNRMAILKELEKREVPTTAEDIYNAISTKGDKYSISSVYRALNQFCDKNIAKKTAEIDGTTYYQLNKGHTHSLICEKCKKIMPINHCPIHNLIHDIEHKTDFIVTGHHLEIKGICKNCQEKLSEEELKDLQDSSKEAHSTHKCKDENCI